MVQSIRMDISTCHTGQKIVLNGRKKGQSYCCNFSNFFSNFQIEVISFATQSQKWFKALGWISPHQGAHYELTTLFLSFEVYNVNYSTRQRIVLGKGKKTKLKKMSCKGEKRSRSYCENFL